MATLTLQLADGTTIEGEVEGLLTARAQDLLNAADRTNLRLTEEASDEDVEGHGGGGRSTMVMRISDDVEGHAFTLRLPSAEAARDLQTKLLATGALVGVVVVGATIAQTAPDLSIGTTPGAAPAPISRSVSDDVGLMDASGAAIVSGDAVIGGAVHPGDSRVDLRTGDNAAPLVPPASADPMVRDGGLMDASGAAIVNDASEPITPPWTADPGVRDRDGGPAPVADDLPTDTPPGGLPRAR
jgi:hypothetical protein